MTKLVLLLGFLGAGKTTLMYKILDKYADKKIGILVNDFGRLNVDGMLLQRKGIPMQELSNGSIFCACIKANFFESLVEMSDFGLEYLFIETSGLVDPSSMPDILEAIAPRIKTPYCFAGSICVVDSNNFIKLLDVFPAVGNQVDYANTIIINKVDLVDEDKLKNVKSIIREINPDTKIINSSYCDVDITSVVEELSFTRDIDRESTNTYESRPKSVMIEGEEVYNEKDIIRLLEDISPHAYRMKGFAETENGPVEVHAVGTNFSVKPWLGEKIEKTQIVVISSVGLGIINVVNEKIKSVTPKLIMIM